MAEALHVLRPGGRLVLAGRLPYRLLRKLDARRVYGGFDHVLAKVRKPGAGMAATGAGEPDGVV